MTVPTSAHPANYFVVESNSNFQELLGKDLQRTSLVNFWAPWAEPCKQMNEVVLELAKKYPDLLVLQVRIYLLVYMMLTSHRYTRRICQTLPSRSRWRPSPALSSCAYVVPAVANSV